MTDRYSCAASPVDCAGPDLWGKREEAEGMADTAGELAFFTGAEALTCGQRQTREESTKHLLWMLEMCSLDIRQIKKYLVTKK